MYSKKLLELFRNPHNVGILQSASGVGIYEDEKTHEIFKLYIKIENETIVDASFKVYSGVAGIAVMSVLTDMLKNKSLEDAQKLQEKELLVELASFETGKRYLLKDALSSVKLAVEDYEKKLEKESKKKKK